MNFNTHSQKLVDFFPICVVCNKYAKICRRKCIIHICTSTLKDKILFTNTSDPSTHFATPDVRQGCHCYTARAAGNVAFCIYYYFLLFIFNFNWIGAPWQWYSTHVRTNSTQNTGNGTYITIKRKKIGKCGPFHFFASYTLAFVLQLRKKHGKISVSVVEK
jgi:hypothetical protein